MHWRVNPIIVALTSKLDKLIVTVEAVAEALPGAATWAAQEKPKTAKERAEAAEAKAAKLEQEKKDSRTGRVCCACTCQPRHYRPHPLPLPMKQGCAGLQAARAGFHVRMPWLDPAGAVRPAVCGRARDWPL